MGIPVDEAALLRAHGVQVTAQRLAVLRVQVSAGWSRGAALLVLPAPLAPACTHGWRSP